MASIPTQRWQPLSQDEKHLLERYSAECSEDASSTSYAPWASVRDLKITTKAWIVVLGLILVGSVAMNIVLFNEKHGMDLDQVCTRHTTITCEHIQSKAEATQLRS